jgi:hypothetical protein
LGNYLLVTGIHNSSLSNGTLAEKLKTFNYLEQHREIRELTAVDGMWDKGKIKARKEKLVKFILENF